ncbi:MAG: hypothetical protein ABI432_06150 [Flavobacteriales bacterium]
MRSSIITALCTAFLLGTLPDPVSAQDQQGSGSPYSAYGFGELSGSTQVTQALMGGTGIALADPFSVSRINPASYVGLLHTSFEAGGLVRNVRYDSETVSSNGRRSDLLGLTVGVPFGRGKWGMALGVNPVSHVGYELTDHGSVVDGTVTYQYTGSGGLNRAFIGLGRMVWQSNDTLNKGTKLTVGANLDYLFGTVEESRKAIYPASGGYYNSNVSSTVVMRAPMASAGLQFTSDLISRDRARARVRAHNERLVAKDKRDEMDWLNAGKELKDRKALKLSKREGEALRFRLGVSAELPANLTGHYTQLANSYVLTASGVEYPFDTAHFVDGANGTVFMPVLLGLGVSVYNSHWMVTAEHRRRDWSQLRVDVEGFDQPSTLATSSSSALGASFRPAGDFGGGFFKRTIYRAGVRWAEDYLVVEGTQLSQWGASLGMSLPLMASSTRSRLNIGVELGERGTLANGLIRERYADVYIGLTLTPDLREQWFRKSRIE